MSGASGVGAFAFGAALAAPVLLLAAAWGGVRAWARPALIIACAIGLVAVPLRTGDEGAALAHFTLPDVAAVGLVGVVGLKALFTGGTEGALIAEKLRSWVMLPLMLVVFAGALAAVLADDVASGVAGWVRLAQIFVVVPLCVYLAIRGERDLKLVLGAALALGLLEGAVGVYQYATGTGATFLGTTRAIGTFGAYEIMGMATTVTYALIVAGAVVWGATWGRSRLLGLAAAGALVVPLALSFSRGAWIAAAVGLTAVAAAASWRGLLAALACAVFLLSAYWAAGTPGLTTGPLADRARSITESVGEGADQSVGDRYALWEASRSMLAERPVSGVGPKNFALHRDEHAPLNFSGGSDITDPQGGYRRVELLTPHSLYWLILAEQGLLGGLAYATFFGSLVVGCLARIVAGTARRTLSSTEKVFALACLGWLAAYLMRSFYADLGGSLMVMDSVVFGGLMWLASGARTARVEGGRRPTTPPLTSAGKREALA